MKIWITCALIYCSSADSQSRVHVPLIRWYANETQLISALLREINSFFLLFFGIFMKKTQITIPQKKWKWEKKERKMKKLKYN